MLSFGRKQSLFLEADPLCLIGSLRCSFVSLSLCLFSKLEFRLQAWPWYSGSPFWQQHRPPVGLVSDLTSAGWPQWLPPRFSVGWCILSANCQQLVVESTKVLSRSIVPFSYFSASANNHGTFEESFWSKKDVKQQELRGNRVNKSR